MKKFKPNSKSLSNNAAQIFDWLDQQKNNDSQWIVAWGQDDNNTLTHLFQMILAQIENWIQYSNCILNNVIHKTNRYDMALLLFVEFNNNHQNILLAQTLLTDKSLDSHT